MWKLSLVHPELLVKYNYYIGNIVKLVLVDIINVSVLADELHAHYYNNIYHMYFVKNG